MLVAVVITALLEPAADAADAACPDEATDDDSGGGGDVTGVVSAAVLGVCRAVAPVAAVSSDEATITSAGETLSDAVEVGGDSTVLATASPPPLLGAVTLTSA